MKKLLILLLLALPSICQAQPTPAPLNITEIDGSPSTYPYKLKFPNGSLTDNGDGTTTVNSTGGASSLTGLSDVGSASTTSGNVLIADGTKYQSKALSGDITVTSLGVTDIGTSKVGSTELISTAVTPGSYTNTSLTVDDDGRITTASSGAAGSSTGGWVEEYPVVHLVNQSDKVGIGTSSPLSVLHVSGSSGSDGITINSNSSGSIGIDGNTVLMLHLNGTLGQTTFTDSAITPKTITANGNAQIDTGKYVFGASSLFLDGNGDYLSAADSSDFAYGSGNFTIDFRYYFDTSVKTTDFISQSSSDLNNYWYVLYFGGTLKFEVGSAGVQTISVSNAWTPSANTWYHIAVVRNGNTFREYINGTQIGTDVTDSDSVTDVSAVLRIGSLQGGGTTYDGQGWMDELRVEKGTAIWTGTSFTPASAEYRLTGGAPQLQFRGDGTVFWTIGDDGPDSNKFKISTIGLSTSPIFTITSAGKTGLNNSSPTEILDVTGNIRSSASLAATSMTTTGSLTFSGVSSDILTGTNEHLALMPNGLGNVGIGTTSPSQKLEVSGTAAATSFTASSNVYIVAPTINQALCLNAAHQVSTCSSIVGAGGGCTCP